MLFVLLTVSVGRDDEVDNERDNTDVVVITSEISIRNQHHKCSNYHTAQTVKTVIQLSPIIHLLQSGIDY